MKTLEADFDLNGIHQLRRVLHYLLRGTIMSIGNHVLKDTKNNKNPRVFCRNNIKCGKLEVDVQYSYGRYSINLR